MFFGSKRKKIAREVLEHLRPLFRTVENAAGPPPSRFANDPYVLGFVVGAAGFLAKAASDNTLPGSDVGLVTTDVVEGLFEKSGLDSVQRFMQLLKQGQGGEFQRGIGSGQKTVLVGLGGAAEFPDDPDVQAALSEVGKADVSAAAAALQQRLFYDYIFGKYGGG